MSREPLPVDTTLEPKSVPRDKTQTRRIPPYNVILENDDDHSMEFVIEVLCKALGYNVEHSYQLTLVAHTSGRSVVWTGPKEGAELKMEQIRTFHEVRARDHVQLGPLGCYIEPAN